MLRNREFQQFVICYLLMTAVIVTAGFWLSTGTGLLAALAAIAYGTIFFAFTRARYERIAQISDQIDLVLHNNDHLYVTDSEEGELSILQSEITKMTLRIREQNAMLKKEKANLADSLADIAHQLRTPLTSLNLILSLLENNPGENERKELLREVEELLLRMDWLITSLLKLSRLDAGVVTFKREQIEMAGLINMALRPLLISLELHNITLQIDVPEGIRIQGDQEWISEAVQNILKNCMESSDDNGKIEITCTDTLLYTELRIHDNGPGFAKEDQRNLFNRYYRGKNTVTAGYGIGLALCKTIIVRQDGTIDAGNHPQGGAVFIIRFPK